MRKVYATDRIEVSFDLGVCIHVGACLAFLPDVFDVNRRPWILPGAAEPDDIAAVVERCPSGALQYRRLDGAAGEAHASTSVTPIQNGPLVVRGPVGVEGPGGTTEVMPRAALCRCGASASKPFCDNSHLRIGFRAEGQPFQVHLTQVRPAPTEPITRAGDPREAE